MIYFRKKAKFKKSEPITVSTDYGILKKNGLLSLNLAAILIIFSSYFVFLNTFPDSVAVYNPFRSEIGLRGVTYKEAFWIFSLAYLVVISLILNSLWFTGPRSGASQSMKEFSRVSFSLNFLKSDYWSYFACIIPSLTFFFVILVAFTYANAFGVSITYLGVITFYQMIQFFQNFKNIYMYYVGKF